MYIAKLEFVEQSSVDGGDVLAVLATNRSHAYLIGTTHAVAQSHNAVGCEWLNAYIIPHSGRHGVDFGCCGVDAEDRHCALIIAVEEDIL